MTEEGSTLGPVGRDRRALFADGEPARSWGDLLADAGRIAARLRPLLERPSPSAAPAPVMLACADRYHGAACLLAIWDVARIAALPPNGREETIDALCAERGIGVLLHDGGGSGGIDVRPWLEGSGGASGGGAVGAGAAPVEPARFAPSQPVACLFTSGSTGAHVPCLKTARQLLGEARQLASLFGMGPEARVLATVPPHHIYGLLFGVLVPLMGGGSMVRGTPQHGETIAAEARRFHANVLCSVPAHLQGLGALGPGALPPLRRIFSSGAPLPAEVAHAVAEVAGVPVTEVFGSSETGGIAWRQQRPNRAGGDGRRADGEGDEEAASLWQAFPGIEVSADADGLMVVRSPFADTPDGGPVGAPVRGADRVRVTSDGRFELLGRADGVVKIGGSRIAVGEVERRLREVPGVREAAVISVEVPGLRRHELWAAVVAPGLTVTALREALRRRLESIAVPRRFRLVEALPREENGKLTKARLQALFAAPSPPEAAPATATGMLGSEGRTVVSRAAPVAETGGRERHEVTVTVAADSPFFGGHFDGFPVLPGVVQLNNLVLHNVRLRWPALDHLRKVVGLKFRNPIRPLDPLAILLERTEAHRVRFEIRSGARLMSSGALVFEGTSGASASRQGPAG